VPFEILHALRDLDKRTPEYFRSEIWAHGDTKIKLVAAHILRTGLDSGVGAVRNARVLSEMLKLYARRDNNTV